MNPQAKRTPTPWSLDEGRPGCFEICAADTLSIIAETLSKGVRDKANAAYIVRAVNAHEKMLSALKFAVAHMSGKAYSIEQEAYEKMECAIRYVEVCR